MQEKKVHVIQKAEPSNALSFLMFGPMKCEKHAAKIQNQAVTCIEENDIRAAAYRYLQNKQGANATYYWLIYHGLVPLFAGYLISKETAKQFNNKDYHLYGLLFGFCCFLALLASIPPNVSINRRYKETTNACREWLCEKLGEETVRELDLLSYSKGNLDKINRILDRSGIAIADQKNVPSRFL